MATEVFDYGVLPNGEKSTAKVTGPKASLADGQHILGSIAQDDGPQRKRRLMRRVNSEDLHRGRAYQQSIALVEASGVTDRQHEEKKTISQRRRRRRRKGKDRQRRKGPSQRRRRRKGKDMQRRKGPSQRRRRRKGKDMQRRKGPSQRRRRRKGKDMQRRKRPSQRRRRRKGKDRQRREGKGLKKWNEVKDIVYGGSSHHNVDSLKDGRGKTRKTKRRGEDEGEDEDEGVRKVGKIFYIRPDFTKSMKCRNGTTCEDCGSRADCWHGVRDPNTLSEIAGSDMEVSVPQRSTFKRFVTVMGATCAPKTPGSWSITPLSVTNGRIELFIDYKHFSDIIPNPKKGGPPVWTKPGSQSTDSCRDLYAHCREKKRNDACDDSSPHHDQWRKECRKTCGYCNDAAYETNAGEQLKLPIKGSQKSHVKVSFLPDNPKQASSATLRISASGIDRSVDNCMAGKNCLQVLGVERSSGFRLRNKNEQQLKCLTGNFTLMPPKEVNTCAVWSACMPKSQKATLKSLLLASGTKVDKQQETNPRTKSLFADKGSRSQDEFNMKSKTKVGKDTVAKDISKDMMKSIKDESEGRGGKGGGDKHEGEDDECIDPSVEDPETWDCECFEDMVKSCGEDNPPCMTNIMCALKNICETWKTANCADSPTSASMQERSTLGTNGSIGTESDTSSHQVVGLRITGSLSNGLDSTLKGKCSM